MPKKQKSGLYRSKVVIGHDGNKPVVKYISGKTKKELEQARQQVLAFYVSGTAPAQDQLFGTYLQKWYAVRVVPKVSESTRQSYQYTINKHVMPVFGERNMRAITSLDLQEWLNQYAGMSNTTITLLMTIIRGVFRSALSDHIVTADLSVSLVMPRISKPAERRALTDDETARLLPLMDNTQNGRYLATLYYLGVRPGEARGLQWGDFDWTQNTVYIQRDIDYAAHSEVGELKTEAATRLVPVPDELRDLLYPVRGVPGAFLFQGIKSGKPLSRTSAYTIWLDLMVRADLAEELPEDQRKNANDLRTRYKPTITPYILRHNYITKCWRAGLDPLIVQRIVRHKDYRTTANIYTHLNNEHIARARDSIASVFAGEKKVAQTV